MMTIARGGRQDAAILIGLMALMAMIAPALAEPPADRPDKKPPKPRVTISKATTYITKPLRKDGYPDYVAHLEKLRSEGAAKDNNFVVDLMLATGATEVEEELRPEFFRKLGVAPPEEGAGFLVAYEEFAAANMEIEPDRDGLSDSYAIAGSRPWTADEFPLMAKWLKAHRAHLDRLAKASEKPKYYMPGVFNEGDAPSVLMILLPDISLTRDVCRAFVVRANFRLANKDYDAAWQDLMAAHGIGRLSGSSPFMIGALVGIACDAIAAKGVGVFAAHADLPAEAWLKKAEELRSLPPLPDMAKAMETERFMYLDCVCLVARGETETLDMMRAIDGGGRPGRTATIFNTLAKNAIDWDVPLKMGNGYYDELIAAARLPHAQRVEAMRKLEERIEEAPKKITSPGHHLAELMRGKTPGAIAGKAMGHIFAALLLPALNACFTAQERGLNHADLEIAALYVAAHRAKHGQLPATLQDLDGALGEKMPRDRVTGEPLKYRQADEGFILYAVGPNGKDDRGRNLQMDWEDEDTPDEADDYRFEVPPPMEEPGEN